jgi:lipoprotein-anchoring transpeptidase ErfK/SrfK
MKMQQAAAAAVLVGVVLSTVSAASAKTYYDPSSHRWVTYDDQKARMDAMATPANAPRQMQRIHYPKPDARFDRQVVRYQTDEKPGTIVIDTSNKFLYYVMDGGQALRMGVGVGREGFGWSGVVHVGAKKEDPKWFPPPEMIQRQPELKKYAANGMPGGDGNPLGVRALYLFDDQGRDTLYRIHGTIEPWSIGQNVSSGCIRMLNENVLKLYDMVPVGTKVVVL